MNIVKRVLDIRPDLDAHTIFRLSIVNKAIADNAYADWIRDGTVHPITYVYCQRELCNEQ